MSMYSEEDAHRFIPVSSDEDYRTEWRRDAARVIHSAAFRRLQGKTQLYPSRESDFFRNRLTHSLEVGQIAKSIAIRLNSTEGFLAHPQLKVEPDICEIVGWVHDIGHPPYGHDGEHALDTEMREHGGFEGNAQTFRVLNRLEKKQRKESADSHGAGPDGEDLRCGLNLTYRVLASTLKYDTPIPVERTEQEHDGTVKGYYAEDFSRIRQVKNAVLQGSEWSDPFKTVECSIMDVADDIAYSTYDLEDSFKAGFITPLDLVSPSDEILDKVVESINRRSNLVEIDKDIVKDVLTAIFGQVLPRNTGDPGPDILHVLSEAVMTSGMICNDAYIRSELTSELVGNFIKGVELIPNEKSPQFSQVRLNGETLLQVEVLKNYVFQSRILSPDLQIISRRGQEFIRKIFNRIDKEPGAMLPPDFYAVATKISSVKRKRVICDFVAGMTDRYAAEYYGRLFSENPESLFKPL